MDSLPHLKQCHADAELLAALAEILRPESLPGWMATVHSAFGYRTPWQVMADGDSNLLWQMVWQMDANVAN